MKSSSLLSLIVCVCLVGCGSDGPDLGDVSGKVTFNGKPLRGAIVTFVPQAGGSTSYGVTDAEGNYELMYSRDKSGAMLGQHNVAVKTEKLTQEDMADGEPVPEFVPIPEKYKQPGSLTAEVNAGSNDINFDLSDQ